MKMAIWEHQLSRFLCLLGILSSGSALTENGENVITRTRLVRVLDEYVSTWRTEWQCESDFPAETCSRIRRGSIDINDVSVLRRELTCAAGWTTTSPLDLGCTTECMSGRYGEDCASRCRCLNGDGICNVTDGTCNCFDGWKGHGCTYRCDPGEYGPNCAKSTYTCINSGINHPASGECLCPHGYRGTSCQERGDPGQDHSYSFDCGQCISLNAYVCDHVSNICLCDPSWTGLYCTEPCKAGSFGLFCDDQCCSGRGHCDVENTRCVCLDGFIGSNCSERCRDGYYGRDCREECLCPSCDHVTGLCDTCPSGYAGDRCAEKCQPGTFGTSCNKACTCPNPDICDVFTGRCLDDDVTTAMMTPSAINYVSPTTDKEDPEDPKGPEDPTLTIVIFAGLTVVTLLVVALFVIASWCYCHHRREKRRRTHCEGTAQGNNARLESKEHNVQNIMHGEGSIYRYDQPPENWYQELRHPSQVVNTIAFHRNNDQSIILPVADAWKK